MSVVKVQGNASGTGIFTIAAPATNTDRTLTLPDVTATLITDSSGVLNIGSGQVYKDASGNVGIGTTTTSNGNLTIQQASSTTGGPVMSLWNSNAAGGNTCGYLKFYSNTSVRAQIHSVIGSGPSYDGNLIFSTGDGSLTERARIDSSGNLLVGTTSSDITAVGLRLMNNNQAQFSKSGDWSLRMGRRDSTGIITEVYYNSSRVGDIATNGSNTTYNSASDYRLKENVQPMAGALTKVAALKPVTFTWKSTGTNDEGFLAHELQAVVPQAVRGEKDEVDADGNPVYQSIDTSVLVATLTAAIQEQQATIESLTARIVALEAK